jgi:O-antigen/teichoic acid export membrane protein
MFANLFQKDSKSGRVFANTSAQIIGKIFSAGTTFVLTLVLARYYGANGYGEFVKITTFVGFFYLATDFGFNAIYIKNSHEAHDSFWGALVGLRILVSAVFIIFALGLLWFIPHGSTQGYTTMTRLGILFFLPSVVFQAMVTSANAVFQQKLQYRLATFSLIIGSVLTLFVLWITIVFFPHIGIYTGILALLSGVLITALVSLSYASRFSPLTISFHRNAVLRILIPALPLGFTLLTNLIYSHVDSVILALYRSTSEVGTYGFAYKIFETLLVVPTFFMNAVYPLLLEAQKTSKNEFYTVARKALFFLFSSSVALFIFTWLASPYISFFNSEFAASVMYLRVLSLALPIFFVSSLVMWLMIILGHQWVLAKIYTLGMIVNITLNVWFTPRVGAMAASWITVGSEAFILCISCLFVIRFLSKEKGKIYDYTYSH